MFLEHKFVSIHLFTFFKCCGFYKRDFYRNVLKHIKVYFFLIINNHMKYKEQNKHQMRQKERKKKVNNNNNNAREDSHIHLFLF